MQAEAEVLTPFRCPRCWELEDAGVETLRCNTCHYVAPPTSAPLPPTAVAPGRSANRERLQLSAEGRERYDYWLELALDVGWSPDVARGTALQRALRPLSAATAS